MPRLSARLRWSGYLLGFSLGGFFDGILLHQILQWHHLLSGLQQQTFSDIRVQILADGIFHALMYVIGSFGVWLLWRARREFGEPGADRLLIALALVGFGIWHLVDAVVFHWLLGIHRVRMDSTNPLTWDLIWFAAFGLIPAIAGEILRRSTVARVSRGEITACLLAALVATGGLLAAQPSPNVSQIIVYFAPGTRPVQIANAAAVIDAKFIWSDASGQVWAFDVAEPERSMNFYRHGAVFVGNSLFPVGCLSWFRAN